MRYLIPLLLLLPGCDSPPPSDWWSEFAATRAALKADADVEKWEHWVFCLQEAVNERLGIEAWLVISDDLLLLVEPVDFRRATELYRRRGK